MTEQEQNQLVKSLINSSERFKRTHNKTPEQAMTRRTSQRDRDIMDSFRNR
ncbi:hypothetical protein RSE72_002778 [Yersinia enterocolitica]|nr:hypothetical protein [Yersinia enterocolitica]ELX2216691.1 hypothetical protein [Yersinia enterocolitica]